MNKQVTKEIEEEVKSPGRFQVFLFIFFIPILFLVFVAFVVLTLSDINVVKKAEEIGISIPFLSEDKTAEQTSTAESSDQKVVKLQDQIKEKEAEISSLNSEISRQQEENQQLVLEQERLQEEMDALRQAQELDGKEFNEIVSIFKEMSGKSAAPVIMNMDDEEATRILSQLPPDILADFFEKMPAEEAARYTQLLAASTP
ncbi:MotE family protein [Jeotgalibacillus soli]|uniref:Magnesium transporter MgtE intracellular domain-containing protein n=1 Tax=Jeotgalibacillus soli TaxID=889306 RepID=A0A0C2VLL0_9BACL|nr:hypothetical protein [Jeotgalibacillus soli]KIL44888.1 hypothetical protein KP78_24320 [Jeotgalibacillus soli]